MDSDFYKLEIIISCLILSNIWFLKVWDPYAIQKSKLMVYLRAAQSITSFNGYCDNQENGPCVIDKGLNTISEDLPMAYTHDVVSLFYNVNCVYILRFMICCDLSIRALFKNKFFVLLFLN